MHMNCEIYAIVINVLTVIEVTQDVQKIFT